MLDDQKLAKIELFLVKTIFLYQKNLRNLEKLEKYAKMDQKLLKNGQNMLFFSDKIEFSLRACTGRSRDPARP